MTVTNVANASDAISFLAAHECADRKSGTCYTDKAATVLGVESQIGLDSDQSMNSCKYRMKFDDGTTATFTATCAAFSPGDRVTGRFWRGRLAVVIDDQGGLYSDSGPVAAVIIASIGAVIGAVGVAGGVVSWTLLKRRRRHHSAEL